MLDLSVNVKSAVYTVFLATVLKFKLIVIKLADFKVTNDDCMLKKRFKVQEYI